MLRDFPARSRRCDRRGIGNCAGVALVAIAVAGLAVLSACGVKGPLKLPTPATPGSPSSDATAPATGARPVDTKPPPEIYIDPAPQPPSTAP